MADRPPAAAAADAPATLQSATSSPPPPQPTRLSTIPTANTAPHLPPTTSSHQTTSSPPEQPSASTTTTATLSLTSPSRPTKAQVLAIVLQLLRRRHAVFCRRPVEPSSTRRVHIAEEHEVTNWHSSPLAFAILPALGGLFFNGGSAFVTDALLLILAAIFLNWSIRIPWDWYYSAQAIRLRCQGDGEDDDHAYDDEGKPASAAQEDVAVTTSAESSPQSNPADAAKANKSFMAPEQEQDDVQKKYARADAACALRHQEILALLATFVFPMLAAWLLHVIRAQLSRPSGTLVSDYNLSVFLLAAEIRPTRQLVRLMASRTLNLQRTATGLDDPFSNRTAETRSTISALLQRVSELEAKISQHQVIPSTVAVADKSDVNELSTELRKRYEPRLEGLERAVRRYEKRSTTLALLTEQRLNSLENRLQDALSLAAVAAQHSQKRGVIAWSLETVSTFFTVPFRLVWTFVALPITLAEDVYDKVKVVLLGPPPPGKSSRRRQNGGVNSEEKALRAKGPGRKAVR
ncbi:hypothetical protein Tdes44962_MAKER05869 [Teratosphaeria destructans]|uniref:Uncharacterized protein n=1 Tax=Teratosphaeria destructans TaxID=418781 RepID=A0A9W7VYL9_9PEZI|nr:hypothetical protein Tdes44962_MAKER05869 [Teratosphaeria destructans]